ncbi:hypothetical protein PFISCL1PPCAC_12108, partial [Pristionchus fissidentatus]
ARMLLQSNKVARHGKNKLKVDKHFSIRGILYVIDCQTELMNPRSPMKIYEINKDLKVRKVEVHYTGDRSWINIFTSDCTRMFVYK